MIWLIFFLAPKVIMTAPVVSFADVTVQMSGGRLSIVALQPGRFDKPTALPRYRGRFTARALKGEKVLEEVNVDLPLLADAETDDASDEARRFAERLREGATVKARVRVPLPEGADAIAIVDSKTNRAVRISLSAAKASPAPSTSAGAPVGAPPAR